MCKEGCSSSIQEIEHMFKSEFPLIVESLAYPAARLMPIRKGDMIY